MGTCTCVIIMQKLPHLFWLIIVLLCKSIIASEDGRGFRSDAVEYDDINDPIRYVASLFGIILADQEALVSEKRNFLRDFRETFEHAPT